MHDGWARLVVLRLGDPHLLEGTQRGEDGPANPHRILTLRGRHHLDLHSRRGQGRQLLRHALADAQEHRSATREHHVGVEVLANVHVALHDGLERGVVDTARLLADEAGLEEHLGASEALVAHGDDVTVWEFVGLLFVRAVCRLLHLSVEIQGDVAQLLLHVTDDLALGCCREGVTTLSEDLHHVLREVAARKIEAQDRVRQRVALVDGNGVRNPIPTVHHDSRGAARRVQREHRLDRHVHRGHVESLEHDLRHPLPICLGVQRSLGEQHRVLLRGDAELIVERVVPNLLHVIPVRDDSVLDGVLQRQHTALALGLVPDVAVFLVHANHDAWHLRAAHDGREHRPGRVVTSEARLAHAAAVVHHERRHLVLRHG